MSGPTLFPIMMAAGFLLVILLAEAAAAEERGWTPLYKVWLNWFKEKWRKIRQ